MGEGVQREGHEHSATECLRKWSWSNIFGGGGGSVGEEAVENETKQLSS